MSKRMLVEISEPAPNRIQVCSGCGALGSAGCDCNLPLFPQAAAAILANPARSNRAIAAELGVSKDTVRNARKATGERSPVDEKRIGRDGKARRLPRLKPTAEPIQEACEDCVTDEQRWQRSASSFLGDLVAMRAYWRKEFGDWEQFEKPSALVSLAKQATAEWKDLAKLLTK